MRKIHRIRERVRGHGHGSFPDLRRLLIKTVGCFTGGGKEPVKDSPCLIEALLHELTHPVHSVIRRLLSSLGVLLRATRFEHSFCSWNLPGTFAPSTWWINTLRHELSHGSLNHGLPSSVFQ